MARIVVEYQENGPYLVIVDGKPLASICRCGLSSTKPLCDGAHERSGFTAPGTQLRKPEPLVAKAEEPVIRAEFPANLAPPIRSELQASLAPAVRTKLNTNVATSRGLEKTIASPAETRNVCKSCGHVNPEWVRIYCVRCAARLRVG